MTNNQIQYQRLQEDKRHNAAMESYNQGTLDETRFNNMRVHELGKATLEERDRHNTESRNLEAYKTAEQAAYWINTVGENTRHNKAVEDEAYRHNAMSEALQRYDTNAKTAATRYSADQSAAARIYSADKSYSSSVYKTDMDGNKWAIEHGLGGDLSDDYLKFDFGKSLAKGGIDAAIGMVKGFIMKGAR